MDEDEEDEEYQEGGRGRNNRQCKSAEEEEVLPEKMAESSKPIHWAGKHIIDDVPSELVVTHAYAGTGDAKEELLPLEDYYDQGKWQVRFTRFALAPQKRTPGL